MSASNNQIDLSKLSIEQLTAFKENAFKTLTQQTSSFDQLEIVLRTALECKSNLLQFKDQNEKEILIPITSSVFVQGRHLKPAKVLIDVGTGYYVYKTIENGLRFYDNKAKYLKEQAEQLSNLINNNQKLIQTIDHHMKSKK